MATYVNNLRLKEIATGDEDGTWGTSTNTNLELITDGFSYGTLDVAADANETFTMPDATANAARGLYIKFTSTFGSLTATRTLTLGPNTVSKLWFIENATTGGQTITIKQGSGATVDIANNTTKVIYADGTGTGAAVVDALALYDPEITDTLAEVLIKGNTSGANNLIIDSGQVLTTNTINETTAASGVTIDSVLLKDNTVTATTYSGALASTVTATTQAASDNSTKVATTAYVDTSSAAHDSLPEVLVVGNTTGGTDLAVSTGDDITFADTSKAIFGAGSDLQIFHNGTESFIRDVGTGGLKIDSNGTDITLRVNATESAIVATSNGSVDLYYDNALKLATTATGIDVTGTLTSGAATIQTLTVGLGAGSVATNTAIGKETLGSNTTGNFGTAVGYKALESNTIGVQNTAVGSLALQSATTATSNTALGYNAMQSTIAGGANTAVGNQAMRENTTGATNVAVGSNTLLQNTTGTSNTAVGYAAAQNNTTGANNVAVGSLALDANTSGNTNVAVGNSSLTTNTTGIENTAIGYAAMAANTIGSYNTAVGRGALDSNTTGSENIAYGRYALGANTTGINNTAIGGNALGGNVGGVQNTAVGKNALSSNTADNNTAVGHVAMSANTTGTLNAAFGSFTLDANTTGSRNSAVAHGALSANTIGADNAALGYNALSANTTGVQNTAVGSGALFANTSGLRNVAVGYLSLDANTSGDDNTAVGKGSLGSNTTGFDNTAVGYQALAANTTAWGNVAVGYQSLDANTTGDQNTAVGYNSMTANTNGEFNVAVGRSALSANTTADNNTAFGYAALSANTTGTKNTALGNSAGSTVTTGSNLTLVGYNAEPSSATATNEMTFGDTNVALNRFNGSLEVSSGATLAGDVRIGVVNTTITGLTKRNLVVGSSTGGEIVAYRADNAGVAGDFVGAFLFGNDDNATTEDHFAGMWGKISGTSGTTDLHWAAGKSNYETDTPQMTLSAAGDLTLVSGDLTLTDGIITGNTAVLQTYASGTDATGGLVIKNATSAASYAALQLRPSHTDGGSFNGRVNLVAENATGQGTNFIIQQRIADGTFATTFTIDEDKAATFAGDVGIGTSAPASESAYGGLSLSGSSGGALTLMDDGVKKAAVQSVINDLYLQSSSQTIFRNGGFTSGDEAMRITSAGDFLLGKTAASSATEGFEAKPSGFFAATRTNNVVGVLNRLSTDGDILDFRKAGTTVGSIGVDSGDNLFIEGSAGSTHSGLQFGTSAVLPHKNGTTANAVVDLGASASQFKDLYLSGTSTVGGLTVSNLTGSIVKLESTGTGLGAGAVIGDLQFYGNDASVPGAGVKASITATTVAALGDDSQLMFSTSDGTTNNVNRMLIANNGDLSLYENTGSTPKFFWDASAEALGIGTSDPSTYGGLALQQSSNTSSKGLAIVDSTAAQSVKLWVDGTNSYLSSGNTGADPLVLNLGGGNVGIGTDAPAGITAGITTLSISDSGSKTTGDKIGQLSFITNDTSFIPTYADGVGAEISAVSTSAVGGAYGLAFTTSTTTASNRAERMRIDSDGNVGIGTSAPKALYAGAQNLVIGDGSAETGMTIYSSTTTAGNIYFADGTAGAAAYAGYMEYNHASNYFRVGTAGAERLRIDSTGNLLVGKTAASSNTVGFETSADGTCVITRSGAQPLLLNRQTSDGDIILFRKDGTSVGRIGTAGAEFFIANNGTTNAGLRFRDSGDIIPANASGTGSNAQSSLGQAGFRFKDLYLAGSAIVGGITTTTLGTGNFVAGSTAGDSIIAGGNYNTLVGDLAGTAITTGYSNVAVGYAALDAASTGTFNTAVGKAAGTSVTTGIQNTLIGASAGVSLTDADYNVAIGYSALGSDTFGARSVAIGRSALASQNFASTTQVYNVGIGYSAGNAITTGIQNTFIGGLAGDANTTANNNTAIGYNSLGLNTTGTSNVALGAFALDANTTANQNTAIGYQALTANTTGGTNTSVGYDSLAANTDGFSNTAVGWEALNANTGGILNVAMGHAALGANISGTQNVALGALALDANTTASNNTAIGYNSLGVNTQGTKNTALGHDAGSTVTNGFNLTLVGYNAEPSSATATNEVTLGDTNVATFRCQVALTVLSDERDKAQIAPINECLDFVNDLDIKSFIMSERNSEETQGELRTGLLAQDLLAVIEKHNIAGTDDLVKSDNPDRLEVTTSDLIFPLIKAVQELSQQVKQLQQKGE